MSNEVTVTVYYFDEPTIGFCKYCECSASFNGKLYCPQCGRTDLSIFTWDKHSDYPE